MSESTGEVPVRQIVQRINAINLETLPPTPTKQNPKKSSFGARAASAVLGVFALTGTAAVVNELNEDGVMLHVAQAAVPEEQKIEAPAKVQKVQEKTSVKSQEKVGVQSDFFDTVFHDLDHRKLKEARAIVEDFKVKIAAKPSYEKEHRQIPQEYKEIIKDTANAYGISEQMLYGIIAIENGGGPDVTNDISKARGVAQFLSNTANQYGLKVNENQDQRADPVLSIDAAGKYLQVHRDLFAGDVGLTMWSYHAGAGNVFEALRFYIIDKHGEDIGSYGETMDDNDSTERLRIEKRVRDLIRAEKIGFYDLASNDLVKSKVISKLDDFTETYVPQITAIIQLEDERAEREVDLGNGLRIAISKNALSSQVASTR